MNNTREKDQRELVSLQYLDALDRGDLDAVERVWAQAAADAELERLLCELNQGLLEEEGLVADWNADAARVRELVKKHLTSGFVSEEPQGLLTAGEIAARLQADAALGGRLSSADRAANAKLLGNPTPLPGELSQVRLAEWTSGLGVQASATYWRVFRQAAVLLAMGRCHRAGELAAARRATRGQKGKQP